MASAATSPSNKSADPQAGLHLIIQIPCFNEADTLPAVVAGLPRTLPGIARIDVLVIDDGSSDDTVAVAKRLGVRYVVSHGANRGLAVTFQTGLDACLHRGADIIVNTDGDNQYPGDQIAALIAPILAGEADMVIGDRQPTTVAHFSPAKRFLQGFGSWVVQMAAGIDVPDATSGFRALTRETALRQIILTRFSYTLETIIQAGKKGLRVAHVPIVVNEPVRASRLVKSTGYFVRRQAATILRIYLFYEPLRAFFLMAAPFVVAGGLLILRFLFFYFFTAETYSGRYIQSVVIGGTLLTVGFLIGVLGVMAELNAANRVLLEEMLYRQRKAELNRTSPEE